MLITATTLPAQHEAAIDLSRWSLFTAVTAGFITCADLTAHIIRRLTQIIALWAEDVLGDDAIYGVPRQRDERHAVPDDELRKLADIARARRRRTARRALGESDR